MNIRPRMYHRGDESPYHPGLIFWGMMRGKERWLTREKFEFLRTQTKTAHAIRYNELKSDPTYKERKKIFRKKYQARPEVRKRIKERRDKPEAKAAAKAKFRDRYFSDPEFKKSHNARSRAWQRKHKDRTKIARDKWLAKPGNKEKLKAAYNAWVAKPFGRLKRREVTARYIATPNGTVANRVRSRIWQVLKQGWTKSAGTLELIGCTISEFRVHIEKQWQPGMTWRNISEWEIDHIKPLASFDLSKPHEQRWAFNYTNCRPLWRKDNRSKSDFLPDGTRARELRGKIIPFTIAA